MRARGVDRNAVKPYLYSKNLSVCEAKFPTSNVSLAMNICQRNYGKVFVFTQSKEIC